MSAPGKKESNIKIVSVVWYKVLPPQFGGQKVIALFNKYLSDYFTLTCLCAKNNEAQTFNGYAVAPVLPVNKFQFVNPWCWIKIVRFAAKEKATHLVLEHPYHAIAGFLAKKILKTRLIIHSHNIEYLRLKSQHKRWWRALASYEKWIHRKADLCVFITDEDLSFAVKHFALSPEKCITAPYCIEMNQTQIPKEDARKILETKHKISAHEKIILFAGTLDYLPNAEAVEKIFEEIAPRLSKTASLSCKIIICGRIRYDEFQYLHQLKHSNVIMAGEVNDINTYFRGADLFINPVTSGGGMQTKVIDALSQNTTTVATAFSGISIYGDYLKNNLWLSDDGNWELFTDNIISALNFQQETNPVFFEKFSCESISKGVAEKIKELK